MTYPSSSKSPPPPEISLSAVSEVLPFSTVETQSLRRDLKSLVIPRLLCRLLDQPMNLIISDAPQYSEQDRRALTWSLPHGCRHASLADNTWSITCRPFRSTTRILPRRNSCWRWGRPLASKICLTWLGKALHTG